MRSPDPLERVDAQVQGAGHGVDPTAEEVPGRACRFHGQRDIDVGFGPCEQLRGDERPGRIFPSATGIQAAEARRQPGSDDRADGRCRAAEHERQVDHVVARHIDRPPRIETVGGQQHHPAAFGCGVRRWTRPVDDGGAGGQGGEHGTDRRGRQIVGDLQHEGRGAPSSQQRRRELSDQVVGVAVGAAVHADEGAEGGARRPGLERAQRGVGPGEPVREVGP
jgi:hypothetical protein